MTDTPVAPLLRTPVPGPRSRAMAARLAAAECPAFDARRVAREAASGSDQTPIVYARGEGVYVYDVDENRFVDFVQGFGAEVFGHAPPFLTTARARALELLPLALGDVYGSEPKLLLLERLATLLGDGARVMLGLSGADAVTAALKTAALSVGPRVLAFHGGYHGLSHGPLAACGLSPRFREPFAGQLGEHVTFIDYPRSVTDLATTFDGVDRFLSEGQGSILVEPILGRGGCIVPPSGFLEGLSERTSRAGSLLIVDEVWTGMGRSGAMLRSKALGVNADVVALGKGLGGGTPIAACIGTKSAMGAWEAHGGTAIHTATHFGNPDGCAAALAVMDHLDDELLSSVRRKGDDWRCELTKIAGVVSVQGEGLMIGVELDDAETALRATRRLLETGFLVLTGGASWNVLTLTPPLDVPVELLARFDGALSAALKGAS